MSRRVRGTRDNGAAGEERDGFLPGSRAGQPAAPAYVLEGNSVVDPGATDSGATDLTELFSSGPLFDVARRGYDQLAVDAYVEATEEELRSLRRRLHAAVVRHRAAADALVEARQRPEDRADELVAAARAEADARLANVAVLREAASLAREEARRDRERAAAELDAARREAEALRREAEEQRRAAAAAREDVEATAALRRAALEAEMADLRRQRDDAVAGLRRLTGQIELALHSLTAVLPPDEIALARPRAADRELLAG